MRVAWVEIFDFRSIKHLRIEGLDKPQVVIEGPNDVGKSNVLHALDLAFSALSAQLRKQAGGQEPVAGEPSPRPFWLTNVEGLARTGTQFFAVNLGIRFAPEDGNDEWKVDPAQIVTFNLRWKSAVRSLVDPQLTVSDAVKRPEILMAMARALSPVFRLVTTHRSPQRETLNRGGSVEWERLVRWEGRNLKQMLFYYKNSPDLEIQERFEQLRATVRDPELGIGIMNVSVTPDDTIIVRTRNEGEEIDLEERGSGVQQLLTLLALSLCHRGKILAIEEPEMNLSEPNQRLLWKKLREFTAPGSPLDQVFVTSHSRVFEEEAERLIVSRTAEAGTQAIWAEPAPARQKAEHEALAVTRGGGITLTAEILKQLGIQEGKRLYLVPSNHGYQLLGPQGYADLLREEDSDDSSDG